MGAQLDHLRALLNTAVEALPTTLKYQILERVACFYDRRNRYLCLRDAYVQHELKTAMDTELAREKPSWPIVRRVHAALHAANDFDAQLLRETSIRARARNQKPSDEKPGAPWLHIGENDID